MPLKDANERREYTRQYYLAHPEQGKARARKYRLAHREQGKTYSRKYRLAHQEQIKAQRRAYYLAHQEQLKARKKARYLAHRAQMLSQARYYSQALKAEALRILGGKCSCPGCEVTEPRFLTIDHIYGRPKGNRKDPKLEAKASGWDKSQFQILCANCNLAKSDLGFCPVHQTASAESNGHSPKGNAQLTLELSEGVDLG